MMQQNATDELGLSPSQWSVVSDWAPVSKSDGHRRSRGRRSRARQKELLDAVTML